MPEIELPSPSSRRTTLLKWGWLPAALLGSLLYLPSLGFDFVYDDLMIVQDNHRIRDISQPSEYLWTSYWNRPSQHKEYRPITMFSYALDYLWARGKPGPHRAVNILLNGAVSAAAWALIWKLFGRAGLATLAAFLFAIHPIHVEVVGGIVGRAELLSAFGFLAALIFAVESSEGSTTAKRYGLAVATGLAAMVAIGSKESGVTVLPAIVLIPIWRGWVSSKQKRREDPVYGLREIFPAFAISFAALGAYMLCRRAVLGGFFSKPWEPTIFPFDNPLLTLDGMTRILAALKLLARYGLMLVWPFNPSPDYSLGAIPLVVRLFDPALIAVVLFIPLSVWGAWKLRPRPAILFGIVFFALTFVITSNVFFLIGTIMGERLLYLPSLGFCIVAADLTLLACEHVTRNRARASLRPLLFAGLALGALWCIALPAQLLRYLPVWRTNHTLFAYMVQRVPGSARAQMLYGQSLVAQGKSGEAIEHFKASLKIAPDIALTTGWLGSAYRAEGNTKEARQALERALRLDPNESTAIMALARLYLELGERQKAEPLYAVALRLEPGNFNMRKDYGLLLNSLGKHKDAIEQLLPLLPREGVSPDDERVVHTIGQSYLRLKDFKNARAFLTRALAANPRSSQAEFELADALASLGRLEEAEAALQRVAQREPQSAPAQRALAQVRAAIEKRKAPAPKP